MDRKARSVLGIPGRRRGADEGQGAVPVAVRRRDPFLRSLLRVYEDGSALACTRPARRRPTHPTPAVRARGALVALAVVVLAACSGTASDVVVQQAGPADASSSSTPSRPGTTTTAPPATTGTIKWTSCGNKLQCAKLTVPLDYSDPSKGTIDLNLKRRPAGNKGNRIGSLLVNPGGPGIPGTELVDQANLAFSNDLLSDFDIVGWDPRGTGESSPVDCVDDLDPYFGADPTPDTPDEKQKLIDLAKQFDAACQQKSGKILPYISTQDSARDMDQIRQALGEDKISYFGFSYGSELGAVWATMFPQTVRAMVIDGASDPNSGYEADLEQQVVGLERTLDAILADCAKDTKCAFRHDGNPGPAFDALAAKLDAQPLKVGDRTVGQGAFYYAVIEALYDRSFWPTLTKALAAGETGDGSGLLDLYDEYLQRNDKGTF